MKTIKNKRGVSKTIVGLIVLLVSFSILLWVVLHSLFPTLKGGISDSTCQLSIEMRAGVGGVGAQAAVPIRCQTKKICFVKDKKEDCKEFEGLDDVEKTIIKENYKENLIKEITLLQYDAWGVLGAGKWDYAPREFWTLKSKKNYCAPYTRIIISDELRKEFEKEIILGLDFIDYQQKNLIPNTKTNFFRYLYGIDSAGDIKNKLLNDKKVDVSNYQFKTDKQYYIMSIAAKKTWFSSILGVGIGGVVTGVLVSTGFGVIVIGAAAGGTIGFFIGDDDVQFMPPTLIEYDAETVNALSCDEFDFSP